MLDAAAEARLVHLVAARAHEAWVVQHVARLRGHQLGHLSRAAALEARGVVLETAQLRAVRWRRVGRQTERTARAQAAVGELRGAPG